MGRLRWLAGASLSLALLPGCCGLRCYDPCFQNYACVRDNCATSGPDYMYGPVYGPESLPNYSTPAPAPGYLIPPGTTYPMAPPSSVNPMPAAPLPSPSDAYYVPRTPHQNASLPSIPEHSPEAGLTPLPSPNMPTTEAEVPPPPAEELDQMRYFQFQR